MPTIIPLHSAAASGGGVSENMFKDMMAEMQGGEREQSPAGGKKKVSSSILSCPPWYNFGVMLSTSSAAMRSATF